MRQQIAGMPVVGTLYGFDSWVANVDRHERNLLLGGSSGVYLIDTGPGWTPSGLKADAVYKNKLKAWLTPVMTAPQRSARAGEAATVPSLYDGLDLHSLAAANYVRGLLDSNDLNALVKFLEDRKVHVARLAANALNMVI